MNPRFYLLLIVTAVLVSVTACTTAPRRDTPSRGGAVAPVVAEELPQGVEGAQAGLPYASMAALISASKRVQPRRLDAALEILHSLQRLSSDDLLRIVDARTYDPEFTEWLELSLLLRRTLVGNAPVTESALQWEQYHYGHVISGSDFIALLNRLDAEYAAPLKVAVLLPETGSLSAAGQAIRDGIISAYLERPGESSLRFYHTGEEPSTALDAYFRAVEDGATQIIGPLHIESTRALASLPVHEIPVLLLNDPGMNPADYAVDAMMVNSLSLSQTEEAVSTADHLLARGQTRAVVIAPETAWGQRLESAFVDAFTNGHGEIVAGAHFDPATSDHSAVLTSMLKIDESNQRRRDLQSRVGIRLEFEPIRRDDFDFIYMVADPGQGRELRPLFRFHDAGEVPVYAAGRVFNGRQERASNQDLDGIVFPVTPWQLRVDAEAMPGLDSLKDGTHGRLYALGRDAWSLLRWLPLLQEDPGLPYQGNIGSLQLRSDGYLSRQPAWARFSTGFLEAYQWQERP